MKNLTHRTVTAEQFKYRVKTSDWFRAGYESYVKNLPFDYDIPSKSAAIDYERGRAFAAWCVANKLPRSTWRNNIMAKTVQERVISSMMQRAII